MLFERQEFSREPEKERSYLDRMDRYVTEEGLRTLHVKLLEMPEEDFPDAVVIVETAARPLAYAIKPVLEDVATKRNLSVPPLFFLQSHSWGKRDEFEAGMKERAGEILKKSKAKRLLLVDDFIARGLSIERSVDAFQSLPGDIRPQVESFVFASSPEHGTEDGGWENMSDYAERKRITIGCTDPPGVFLGFSFRRSDEQSALTGVKKSEGGKHVVPSDDRNPIAMRKIRDEMKVIANKVLTEEPKNPFK